MKQRFLYRNFLVFSITLIAIVAYCWIADVFLIDSIIIGRTYLWDMVGQPYRSYLRDLNLPNVVGALFVHGEPDNLKTTEDMYRGINLGHIFTSQLRSLVFDTKITATSISQYINSSFVVLAIIFSMLVGTFIFRSGFAAFATFLLIMIFRENCQGLIYGLPIRSTYAVFFPLIVASISVLLIAYKENSGKRYHFFFFFFMSGFALAYISHVRTSEGLIAISALFVFGTLMILTRDLPRLKKTRLKKTRLKKTHRIVGVVVVIVMSLGFFGYQKMLDGFVTHRDSKLGVEKTISKVQISQSPYHNLFISLFRFPNRFGVGYQDITGIQHVYSVYPEIKEAFGDDYFELVHSSQYNRAIKSEYFSFILSSPGYFIEYVAGGLTDYLLFLPYASWSGSKSAPAYLPKINNDAQLDAQDMPPDFRSSGFQWILNLRFSHLPSDIYFWTYFVIAYSLLLGAIYSAFFARVKSKEISSIYLIRALLIYFAFASIVRILIPNYGHSAAISFNLIIVVYFIHLTMSFREKIRAKTSRLYVLTTSLLLSGVLTVLALTLVDNNVKAKEVEVDMADMYLNGDNSENSSMTIRSTKDGPGSASIFVPVTPGGTYEISASLNGDTADYQTISVETFDKISLASSGHISANARDPKFFRSRFKIGDYDDIIVLKLICGASTSGQAVNFSSISLLKIEDTGASKEVKLPLDMDSSLRSIN